MQTFLPHWNLKDIAKCLDNKRLNKQIVEAAQIETAILKHQQGIKAGWQSHPCILMWYHHTEFLAWYRHVMSVEFTRRYGTVHSNHIDRPPNLILVQHPPWWYDDRVRASHRAMLYRKDPIHYPEEWKDDSILDYHWPWRDEVNRLPTNEVMKFPSGKEGSPELTELVYPRYGSIKYDGSFCLVFDGELYSRNLKLHPNRFLRERFAPIIELGQQRNMIFMGEIFDPTQSFSDGQSITRSFAEELKGTSLFVFDCLRMKDWLNKEGGLTYRYRYGIYKHLVEGLSNEFIIPTQQEVLDNHEIANRFFEDTIRDGHEGIVTRSPDSYYKYGRRTRSEQDLFRHTKNSRIDAVVLEILPKKERRDGVPVPKLSDGRAHRSFKKDDYVPVGVAGSLTVRDERGRVFGVGFGQGWNDNRKRELWGNRHTYLGKVVELECKEAGEKDLPRHPKLIRFRDDKDGTE